MPTDTDYDDQDGAEVLDETNLTDDGEDIANFDELDDVLDVTQAEGDDDEDEEDTDFDDEDADEIEDELEGERDDEGLDVEREPLDAIAGDEANVEDAVSDDDDSTADFESTRLADDDIESLGYAKNS